MSYYLAIDQGSHASRALLFDERGDEVASASRNIKLNRLDTVRVEHDAAELLASVDQVVSELLDGLDKKIKQQIAACGLSTQRSSVLAWNTQGEAQGPVLSWQDVRAAALLDKLKNNEAEIQKATGLPLSAHYGASKLHWLLKQSASLETAPEGLRVSPLVSFILFHILGESPYLVDHCNAQRTQLMDINTLDWSPRLCKLFGVPLERLPACRAVCADYGVLKNTSIPLTAVCGDQNAAMHGDGELGADTALVNLGSGAFILRSMDEYRPSDRQLSGIAYSDSNHAAYLREATINAAGSALDWLAERYNIIDIEQRLPAWLASVDTPLLFINTLGGLGSPWWRQGLAPRFIAADYALYPAAPDHAAMAVAVIESIVFMLRANLDLMREESPIKRLRVSGGLSASDGLCQKLANLCVLPVVRTSSSQATARGVAWLAAGRPRGWFDAEAAGVFEPADDAALLNRYHRYLEVLEQVLKPAEA